MVYDSAEHLSTSTAARIAGRSCETIRIWAERYEIGDKICGRWRIYRSRLERLLAAGIEADQ